MSPPLVFLISLFIVVNYSSVLQPVSMVFQSFQLNIVAAQQHISSYINDIIKNQIDHPEEHVRGVILRKEKLLSEKLDTGY
nr:hypothetical protein BgiMline_001835 [Biomphalaria glabrata]